MKRIKIYPRMASLVLAGGIALSTIPLCGVSLYLREKIGIDQKIEYENQNIQEKEVICNVEGEDFGLAVSYDFSVLSKEKWEIMKDKGIYLHLSLIDLEEGTKIYVSDLQIDTKLISENRELDGFVQSSSYTGKDGWKYGYPLYANERALFFREIEGQSELFRRGMDSILPLFIDEDKRSDGYSEEEYHEAGILGNEISVKVGLMVEKDGKEPYRREVTSSINIPSYLTHNELLQEESNNKRK